mgnify:CR=1 FL=1|tara:strand:+ start:874 stop:1068 length:195 start_codon:yes stop_codon:yes gene_type:complete
MSISQVDDLHLIERLSVLITTLECLADDQEVSGFEYEMSVKETAQELLRGVGLTTSQSEFLADM